MTGQQASKLARLGRRRFLFLEVAKLGKCDRGHNIGCCKSGHTCYEKQSPRKAR